MQNPISTKYLSSDPFYNQEDKTVHNQIHLLVPLTYTLSKGKIVQSVQTELFGKHKGTLKYCNEVSWSKKDIHSGPRNRIMFGRFMDVRQPMEFETRKVVLKPFKLGPRDSGKSSELFDAEVR